MRGSPRWLIVAVPFLALVLVAGGTWFYVAQDREHRRQTERTLAAIRRLKANQIAEWRAEHLDDAAMLTQSPFLIEGAAGYIANPREDVAEKILSRFRALRKYENYSDVMLVDAEGQVRLSLSGRARADSAMYSALAAAYRVRKPILTDLHLSANDSIPHFGVIAPLFAGNERSGKPIGAFLLIADARRYLFPLIASWPVPSRTAETLLIRRDGDDVLFLSDLRHRPNMAMKNRFPLSRTDMPAVQAVLGRTGVIRGIDYTGIPVLAVVLPVPDSPWFMVAKMDAAEAFAAWRELSITILAVLFGLLIAAGASVLVIMQRNEKERFADLYRAEAAARTAEKRYGVTLTSIGDGVIATDARGRVDLLNPVAEDLAGWSNEDARGRSLDEVFRIISEETRAVAENPVARVLREGIVIGLANHTLLVARDGTERPVADSGAPIRDEDGSITGVVLVFRDQTEERAAQRALRKSWELYRSLFENMLNGFAYCRMIYEDGVPKDFVYLDVNAAFEAQTGLTDVVGKWVTEVIPGIREADPELFERYGRVALTGEPERFETYVAALRQWFAISVYSPEREHFVAVFDVVTERKKAEEEIRRNDALLNVTQSMSRIGGWEWDVEKQTTYWTDETYRIHEIDRADVVPGSSEHVAMSASCYPPDARERVLEAFRRCAEEGVPYDLEVPFVTAKGRELWVRTAAEPVAVDGRIVKIVGNIMDITEGRRAEEEREKLRERLAQAQKLESVGRLAGGVAHDFNNMLGVILGHAELALEQVDPDHAVHTDLVEISRATQRSADLVRQLLAFARKQTIAPKVLDLNDTVAGMLGMLRRLIGEDVDLAWMPGANLAPLKIDPSQVDQVLANLCVNARDAIGGVGRIAIETANAEFDEEYCAHRVGYVPGPYVMLAVSDDGSGMDKDTVEHLFEPFFTTKNIGEGTGLGLSTVYGIVKQNEGFINVYSEPGKGSTFRIYLPRYAGSSVATAPTGTTIPARRGDETVLLVEDERAILDMGTLMLERLGYRVLAASTPADAIRLATTYEGTIHLLMSDVVMPEMNGRDLAARIAEIRPGVKCLFMSGYTANVIADRGVLDEGVRFIQKPFSIRDLADKVREVLAQDGSYAS